MKDKGKKEERKRRKEGEIIERGNGEDWFEAGRRKRRNYSGGIAI